MEQICAFGQLLHFKREELGLPLWRVAANIPCPEGNLSRIDRGLREPRLDFALKIVAAMGFPIGDFMDELGRAIGLINSGATIEELPKPNVFDGGHVHFGQLFRELRLAQPMTQGNIAEKAGYTSRNLMAVEAGKQVPKVLTAVRLVHAANINLRWFFNILTSQTNTADQAL